MEQKIQISETEKRNNWETNFKRLLSQGSCDLKQDFEIRLVQTLKEVEDCLMMNSVATVKTNPLNRVSGLTE